MWSMSHQLWKISKLCSSLLQNLSQLTTAVTPTLLCSCFKIFNSLEPTYLGNFVSYGNLISSQANILSAPVPPAHHTHTHTHTHTQAHSCLRAFVCVCVCVCVWFAGGPGADKILAWLISFVHISCPVFPAPLIEQSVFTEISGISIQKILFKIFKEISN